MEFLHAGNDPNAPIDAIRVNWYYRPKDIGRRVQDTRLVFASMHSDTCPLGSLRGKCTITHLTEIDHLDTYRTQKDCFWFDKLYDRYMHRYYEVVPTNKVVNVPPRVKEVLDTRWKFVLIEVGRGRDLTSASKRCVRCEQFAANNDSVDCAVCKNTYHMRCVRPPLLKKPARGFGWSCAACSRKQELRMEARNTPTLSESAQTQDDEPVDDEEEDLQPTQETRDSSAAPEEHPPPTAAQIAQANLWPWRYLGVHSRVEDALDYDDRIYPRASSRLGPRHQANVNVWHGRPVELVKPSEIRKKYMKHAGSKKDGKMTKETMAAIEAEKESKLKRPKWVIDEPVGYVARGQDEPIETKGKKEYTAQVIFKMPDPSQFTERGLDDTAQPVSSEALVDEYIQRVKPIAGQYDVRDCSVDFLTKAIEKLQESSYDVEKALSEMKKLSKKTDLKQPDLNREEVKRFEEGVQKYGSELHAVARHVGNIKESRIVRFYYMWKKTDRGRQIWGNYEGRKSKKESKRIDKDGSAKLVDDVADDADDSAFDNEKALAKKRGFMCKHCATQQSRQWRRAPGTAPGTLVPPDSASKNSKDKSTWLTLALCGRCAYLWRRYAIVYESIEEISKKIAAAGGRASKRKVDEELLRTIFEAQESSGDLISPHIANEASKFVDVPPNIVQIEEPPKKKAKPDKDSSTSTPDVIPEKKKPAEKVPEAPLEPEPPRVKIHPCAVCHVIEVPGQELLKCRDCRLHVHGACYGVNPKSSIKPFYCDMCRNDHNPMVSTQYECVLCPWKHTHQELMEPLKVSHKKKSDREREKERLEREMIQEASKRWRQEQEASGRPVNPREALKHTAANNWVHIICALWTKEMKFANAHFLEEAEGKGFIAPERYEPPCKLCKPSEDSPYPTFKCSLSACNNYFHIGCAHAHGYIFGFDIQLVKGSRRDSVNVIKLDQETGVATPGIWCPNHAPPTYVHSMIEQCEGGLTALQLFARTYKQADLSITGTVRRAAQYTTNFTTTAPAVQMPQRQATSTNGAVTGGVLPRQERVTDRSLRSSPEMSPTADAMEIDEIPARVTVKEVTKAKRCCSCLVHTSPKWYPVNPTTPGQNAAPSTNGFARPTQNDRPYTNGIPQPNMSPRSRTLSTSLTQPVDRSMVNGVVKTEAPETAAVKDVPISFDEPLWQCHKCHVNKVQPPSSPSQIRRHRPTPTEPEHESGYDIPTYSHPPSIYQYPPRPPVDGPPHPHPGPSPVMNHSPWQGGPAQWSAPVMRDGPPPPPGPGFGGSPYRPEFASPFAPRAGPQPPYNPNSAPPASRPPQHSPPPVAYGPQPHHHPLGHQPSAMSGRPPSPKYSYPSHGGLGIGGSSMLSRPYQAEPGRHEAESKHNGYGPPPPPTAPRYGPPPPAPIGPPSAQSLAKIAQAASEQSSRPPVHERQISGEATPRTGPLIGIGSKDYTSPSTTRPMTPADGPTLDRNPGASASPSLKNLLS